MSYIELMGVIRSLLREATNELGRVGWALSVFGLGDV